MGKLREANQLNRAQSYFNNDWYVGGKKRKKKILNGLFLLNNQYNLGEKGY